MYMTEYLVRLTRTAEKELDRIAKADRRLLKQLLDAIGELKTVQRPDGVVKLKSGDGYRIRVREYRILYTVDDDTVTVEVFRVAKRSAAYP